MSRTRLPALITLATAVPVALLSLGGCSLLKRQAAAPTPAAATPKPGPELPKIDYAAVRPNELGRIPVIMYHEVKGKENKSLTRSVADFQKDLELMYEAGFYPVNLSDVANNNISVPAGKSPIVLTFDDGRQSQFNLIETPTTMKVDPDCALGILEAFNRKHPTDWPLRATFFVLPKSPKTMDTFGQLGLGGQKMQYLLQKGMEIGNHTTNHKTLRGMTAAQIQQEIGYANNQLLLDAPDAKIQVFAAPRGQFPSDKKLWPLLNKGTFEGKTYEHKLIMLAAWRPMPSPASTEFKPGIGMERIDSIDGLNGVRDWIKKLSSGGSVYQRYVSDGDPNVISYPKNEERLANVNALKAEGKLAYGYTAGGGIGGAKPIVGTEIPTEQRTIDTTPPGGSKPIITEGAGGATPATSADSGAPAKPISGTGG